jgi:alpha-L-arabinofuranosidase
MRLPLVSLLLVFATASAVQAQKCIEQIKFPEVGRWAEYKAIYNEKDPYTVRYAVIGSEKRGGADLKWVELRMVGQSKDKNFTYQMLIPGSPTEMTNVQEIIMKAGDRPAMKMNEMMIKMIRGQMDKQNFLAEVCKGVTLVGPEKVTVAAGQFSAQHFHSDQYSSDAWVANGVPFSLVKSVGKNYQMELAVHGKDGKSSITEKPQEMPGMGGPSKQ